MDLQGKLHALGGRPGTRAVVVVFMSVDCPISNGYVPQLNKMVAAYRNRGVEFFGVISDQRIKRARAISHRKEFNIGFPMLFDATSELRRRLGATHTPQAFVLDAAGRQVYGDRKRR